MMVIKCMISHSRSVIMAMTLRVVMDRDSGSGMQPSQWNVQPGVKKDVSSLRLSAADTRLGLKNWKVGFTLVSSPCKPPVDKAV